MGRGPVLASIFAACAICACKAQVTEVADAAQLVQPDGAPPIDGLPPMIDAPSIDAPLGDFAAPAPVSVASDPTIGEDDCALSSTQLELYFAKAPAGGPKQLYVSTRASTAAAWGTPAQIFPSGNTHESPRLSPDDLTIYYGENGNIMSATRTAVGQPWSAPAPLAQVNTINYEKWFAVCNGGYFLVSRATGNVQQLYEGQLGAGGAGTLSSLSDPNGSDISSYLSPDCKTAYWASNRVAGAGTQIYTATRPSPTGAWTAAALASFGPNFGTATDNEDAWLSPDTRTLYFATERNGTQKDLYFTTR